MCVLMARSFSPNPAWHYSGSCSHTTPHTISNSISNLFIHNFLCQVLNIWFMVTMKKEGDEDGYSTVWCVKFPNSEVSCKHGIPTSPLDTQMFWWGHLLLNILRKKSSFHSHGGRTSPNKLHRMHPSPFQYVTDVPQASESPQILTAEEC